MQTLEQLTNEILRDLPEISGYTIKPQIGVVNGEIECYHDGQILFSGANRLELEREYQMFAHAEFGVKIPF